MRLRTRRSPLLLLLAPTLITAIASDPAEENNARAIRADPDAGTIPDTGDAVGTKDAPVDGKDGMPHEGPWVGGDSHGDSHGDRDGDAQDLPPLQGRPDGALDGIPETNDGVMDDPNRPKPKEGTTGTEGGISEKEKARLAQEGETGEQADNVPEAPKEAPPLPNSDDSILNQNDHDHDHLTADEVAGIEKPGDLPDKPYSQSQVVADSADKDHFVTEPYGGSTALDGQEGAPIDENEGMMHPFHSYVLSLTMILVSEVGDKTFLVAALMAMKHDRMLVFSAAFSALLVMTVLSAILGHAVPTLVPQRFTSFAASALFFIFGGRLLKEGLDMDPNEGVSDEMHEVERELAEKEQETGRGRGDSNALTPQALEMGLAVGGDKNGGQYHHNHKSSNGGNGRMSRSQNRFPSPPRSPLSSPSRSPSRTRGLASASTLSHGFNNLCSFLLSPAWVQTFVMTFLGEWGDRSQIATIAMAAGQDYWWVTFGAMTGHCVCTGVAVIGGRAIAGRVSLRIVTIGGALAFLVFGFIYFFEAFYA